MLINALTYNLSWATQINKVLGSEADFVEACQKEYKTGGKECTKNAIANIGKLPKLDLIGLQEVNSDIEKKVMKVQSNLKQFKRGTAGRSIISILWNPSIFGELVFETDFNLVKDDDRPCLILVFKKGEEIFVIINLHMPWAKKRSEAIKTLENTINKNKILRENIYKENAKIIMMGDFNDINTSINKNSPLILRKSRNNEKNGKTLRLKYNKTKAQARKTLKSCCWHKPKHQYKYFSDTGDYILVNKNIKEKSIKIPEIFRKAGRLHRLFSDHMPVFAELIL